MAWRIVFGAAALFNLAVGAALLGAPAAVIAGAGLAAPPDYFYVRTAGLLIAVFGIGYAMAAAAPQRNRPIVWLGMIGKAAMPVISGLYVQAGLAPLSAFLVSLGDLGFALLFALFLLRTKPL